MNTTAAREHDFIAHGDLDCSVSQPNALRSLPKSYITPAVIRVNNTALAAANLSDFFDVVSFSWKPMGPAPPYTYITMEVWRLEDTKPAFLSSLYNSWGRAKGFLAPTFLEPPEYWPGWGKRANWIEMQAWTGDEEPWEFCLDNLVLRFYAKEADSDPF